MNSELYQDAQSRLPIYALYSQLQIQILSKSRTLAQFGLAEADAQSWFVFLVMCFLMRRSLELPENDGCTLPEIAWEIQDLIKTHYPFVLSYEQCLQLARTVVLDILCNGGSPIVFHTGDEQNQEIPLAFLSSPSVIRGGQSLGAYRMSRDGFRILLGTREVEENLKTDISSMIISLQLQSKNYKGALEEARDEIDRLRIHESSIREMIVRLKADVLSIPVEKAHAFFEENTTIYERARIRFQEIRQNVTAEIRDIQNGLEVRGQDEKLHANLELMNKIDESLIYAIQVTGSIIAALQDFLYTQRNELISQLGISRLRAHSIRKDVYEPFLENPDQLEELMDLLHPLFFRPAAPIFNLDRVFHMRQLQEMEEEEADEYEEEDEDEEARQQLEQRKQQVQIMHEITQDFLDALDADPFHTLTLSQFLERWPRLKQEEAATAKELLASWSMNHVIDLSDLLKQEAELDSTALDTLYSLPLSYLAAAKNNPELKRYVQLKTDKADGEVSLVLEENGLRYKLTIDNIQLHLERKAV